ncbi:MAG: L-seryl-tRNA(Sec) selenium transferase [Tissierellia bacterium]|nr:L-seryl-tRNA(Sec) selenium transferase [Tissierellia bacterium]
MMEKGKLYASIPKVDDFLNDLEFMDSVSNIPRKIIMDQIRKNLDEIRKLISNGESEKKVIEKINKIKSKIIIDIIDYDAYRLKTVINAAGVIIHTNLGRSLINEEIMDHVHKSLTHYSNLEYDLVEGRRGSRYDILTDFIRDITGAEDVLVVNNNAAAVMLALSTVAKGKEVILSRGEMVEIGGAFRVPEVLESSGASLVAIGTTNKTKLSDYEKAITENTAALLKVHTSNYRIVGFTESVDAEELKPLKEKYNIPIIEDLGSGVLIDLSKYGIEKEPTVQESIQKGIDIVSFSGDKLLGGPQAGIIVGKKKYIEEMKRNPLTRALRIDKFTISALEATMKYYYNLDEAVEKIPTLRMITSKKEDIKKRVEIFKTRLYDINGVEISIEDSLSEVGGGSLPTEKLPSASLCLKLESISPDKFEQALRKFKTPIIARIQDEKLLFDFRTVQDDELDLLEEGIRFALNYYGE